MHHDGEGGPSSPLETMTPTITNPASKTRRGMRFYVLAEADRNPAGEVRYKF